MDKRFELILRPILDVEDEVLSRFDCGNPDLNHFLTEDGKQYSEHGITQTSVAFNEDDSSLPIAYFSLSADAICLNITERGELGLPFDDNFPFFPAVKITKLAVHKHYQSKGIGKELVDLIQGMVYTSHLAVRLLNVNAINDERTLSFYQRVGFLENLDAQAKREQRARRKSRAVEESTVLMHRDIYLDS